MLTLSTLMRGGANTEVTEMLRIKAVQLITVM